MWSYSKLTKYEKCPYQLVLGRIHPRGPTPPAAQRGIDMHKSIEDYLNGGTEPVVPSLVLDVLALKDRNASPEAKWAFTQQWQPCEWGVAWGKCIIDALVVTDNKITIIDFKTGKLSPISHGDQAQTYAIASQVFYHDTPVTTEFWYLDLNCKTIIHFTPEKLQQIKPALERRVNKMLDDTVMAPKPAKYTCPWCDFKKFCDYAYE